MSTEQSAQINELATALAKAQGAFTAIPKTKEAKVSMTKGGEYRYKYADLADTLDVVRKPLADNGLAIIQSPAQLERGVIAVTTMLVHASGQWIKSTLALDARDATPQSVGTIVTYARRYALSGMLGLATDDDTDAAEHKEPPRQNGRGEGGASYNRPAASGNGTGTGTRANDVVHSASGGNRVRTAHAAAVAAGVAVEPPPADLDALTAAEITEWLTYYRASMPRKAEHTA